MRTPFSEALEAGRARGVSFGQFSTEPGSPFGLFRLRCPATGQLLKVIASDGDGMAGMGLARWEHVSVSTPSRCPTWDEMNWIKDLFWREEETVMQLHPPKSRYANVHPFVLHLWRPVGIEIPVPPLVAV